MPSVTPVTAALAISAEFPRNADVSLTTPRIAGANVRRITPTQMICVIGTSATTFQGATRGPRPPSPRRAHRAEQGRLHDGPVRQSASAVTIRDMPSDAAHDTGPQHPQLRFQHCRARDGTAIKAFVAEQILSYLQTMANRGYNPSSPSRWPSPGSSLRRAGCVAGFDEARAYRGCIPIPRFSSAGVQEIGGRAALISAPWE